MSWNMQSNNALQDGDSKGKIYVKDIRRISCRIWIRNNLKSESGSETNHFGSTTLLDNFWLSFSLCPRDYMFAVQSVAREKLRLINSMFCNLLSLSCVIITMLTIIQKTLFYTRGRYIRHQLFVWLQAMWHSYMYIIYFNRWRSLWFINRKRLFPYWRRSFT